MRETTSSFSRLKAERMAGQISAYIKAPLLSAPVASTVSAIVVPDISGLQKGSEKGGGNLFILERNRR